MSCLLHRKNQFSNKVLIMFSLLLLMFHLQYQYQLEYLKEGLQECLEAEAVASQVAEVEDMLQDEESLQAGEVVGWGGEPVTAHMEQKEYAALGSGSGRRARGSDRLHLAWVVLAVPAARVAPAVLAALVLLAFSPRII